MPEEEKKATKPKVTKNPHSKESTKKNQYITENEYPTLYVKNFGKIEEGEVELAPFTLFVGDNNSGKSYLMNLIWGLQTYPYFHFRNLKPNNKKINKFFENLNVISENKITGAQKIVLTEDHVIELLEMLNTVLDDNKNQIAQHILNDANTSISELQLKISKKIINSISLTIDISLDEDKDWNLDISSNIQNHAGITIYDPIDSELSDYLEEFLEEIMGVLVRSIFKNSDTTFLPASRTGFLLTHELINIDTWGKRFNKKNDAKKMREIVFLRSVNSFVQDLMKLPLLEKDRDNYPLFSEISKTTDKFQTYVEFIQTHLIHGTVFIDNNDKQIKYRPIGSNTALSMHVSSSVVTEIAPLALFLQYGVLQDTLFMEEPEISLHPKLQQQIARLLIKLVTPDSGGKQVFITTHSDTIIQHINNMIKLYNNSEDRQKKLLNNKEYFEGYESNDILNPEKIRMYQFDVNNNKTTVYQLRSSKYGFEVPTFNDFLDDVSEQVSELLEEL